MSCPWAFGAPGQLWALAQLECPFPACRRPAQHQAGPLGRVLCQWVQRWPRAEVRSREPFVSKWAWLWDSAGWPWCPQVAGYYYIPHTPCSSWHPLSCACRWLPVPIPRTTVKIGLNSHPNPLRSWGDLVYSFFLLSLSF